MQFPWSGARGWRGGKEVGTNLEPHPPVAPVRPRITVGDGMRPAGKRSLGRGQTGHGCQSGREGGVAGPVWLPRGPVRTRHEVTVLLSQERFWGNVNFLEFWSH